MRLWWTCAAALAIMTLALLRLRPVNGKPVVALDFAHAMLARARQKFSLAGIFFLSASSPMEADALHMPIEDSSVDLITSAFGFRNLANYEAGLETKFSRVLRPGGGTWAFSTSANPKACSARLYQFYFRHILPRVGRPALRVRGLLRLSAAFGGAVSGTQGNAGHDAVPADSAMRPGPPTLSALPACTAL